jgi:hypothetical protein
VNRERAGVTAKLISFVLSQHCCEILTSLEADRLLRKLESSTSGDRGSTVFSRVIPEAAQT